MFGRTYLGLVHDTLDELIEFVVACRERDIDLHDARQGSMGFSTDHLLAGRAGRLVTDDGPAPPAVLAVD
jgi:hypothetical protein